MEERSFGNDLGKRSLIFNLIGPYVVRNTPCDIDKFETANLA